MQIKEVSINKLNPAKYNPRKDLQPDDPEYIKLKRSMEEFGDVDPIVWNEQTGNIIGGHQRFKIYQEMGHKKLKVSVVNLTEKAEAVLNVALNKISGEWDYPMLKDLISEIDTGEFDIDLTGFSQEDLDKMFGFQSDIPDETMDQTGGNNHAVLKIEIPGGVWFDSKDKIIESIEGICTDYGLILDSPKEPQKQKKSRF